MPPSATEVALLGDVGSLAFPARCQLCTQYGRQQADVLFDKPVVRRKFASLFFSL